MPSDTKPLRSAQAQESVADAVVVGGEVVPATLPAVVTFDVQATDENLGKWRGGNLCDCCLDCAVCCSVMYCPFVGVAQLAQRYSPMRHGAKVQKCKVIAVILSVLFVCTSIFSKIYWENYTAAVQEFMQSEHVYAVTSTGAPRYVGPTYEDVEQLQVKEQALWPYKALAGGCSAAFSLLTCFLLLGVRARIRRQQRIPPSCCGEAMDDCCLAFCCTSCETCRIMRHALATATPANQPPAVYEFCSPEATTLGEGGDAMPLPPSYPLAANAPVQAV